MKVFKAVCLQLTLHVESDEGKPQSKTEFSIDQESFWTKDYYG